MTVKSIELEFQTYPKCIDIFIKIAKLLSFLRIYDVSGLLDSNCLIVVFNIFYVIYNFLIDIFLKHL